MKKVYPRFGISLLVIIFTLLFIRFPLFAGVNADGSFSYSVPVDVPPGTNGMQPGLSLEYNSNVGNGILGVGWDLAGIPTITRDPQSGIEYKSNDHYIGPNGKLVETTSGYMHYEEENFSRFSKKTRQVNSDGMFVTEIQTWIETKPDGTKYHYGSTEDSRIAALTHESQTRLWALSKVEDIYGNYYTINYEQDQGAFYPKKIVYTLNDAGKISKYRKIEFEYEDREDVSFSYRYRTYVKTSKRLKSIRISTDVSDYLIFELGKLVRRYELIYSISSASNKSLLSEIRKYGDDDSQYQAVRFDWNQEETGWSENIASFEPPVVLTEDDVEDHGVRFVDLNGDGLSDCIQYRELADGSSEKGVWMNSGSGWEPGATAWITPLPLAVESKFDAGSRFADFNGDGLIDFVVYRKVNAKTIQKGAWINTGQGWLESPQFTTPMPISDDAVADAGARFINLNDDVLVDFVVSRKINDKNIQREAWINTGQGWQLSPELKLPVIIADSRKKFSGCQFVDLNADGKSDIVNNHIDGNLQYTCGYLNKGTSWGSLDELNISHQLSEFTFSKSDLSASVKDFSTGVVFTDLNGDSLPDMLWNMLYQDGHVEKGSVINTGSSWIPYEEYTTPVNLMYEMTIGYLVGIIPAGYGALPVIGMSTISQWTGVDFVDVNADGLLDLLYNWYVDSNNNPREVYGNTGLGFSNSVDSPYALPYYSSYDKDVTLNQNKSTFYPPHNGNKSMGTSSAIMHYMDLNGDAGVDIVWSYKSLTGEVQKGARFNKITSNELIVGVHDGIGGAVEITYEHAYQKHGAITSQANAYPYVANRSNQNLVSKVTLLDGRGNTYATSYDYYNGKVFLGRPDEIKNLLFKYIEEYNDQTGSLVRTYYRQDTPLLAGRIMRKEIYAGNSDKALINKTEYYYYEGKDEAKTIFTHSSDLETTRFIPLKLIVETTYEDGQVLFRNSEYFEYDQYGNLQREVKAYSDGLQIITDDKYNVSTNDLNRWVLNRKTSHKMTSPGQLLSWDTWTYTDPFIYKESYLDSSDKWLTTVYEKDVYGNISVVSDIRGNKTRTSFDEEYYTFPTKVVNPLGHTLVREYNEASGCVLSETDPNNNTTRWEYDTFGRVTKEIQPGDDWTREIVYYDTPSDQRFVETRSKDDSDEGYLYSREYFDGLNRKYRVVNKAYQTQEDDLVLITDYTMNSNAMVQKKTNAYLARVSGTPDNYTYTPMEAAGKTRYSYDEAGRTVRVDLPDGAWKTIDYTAVDQGLMKTTTTSDSKVYREVYNPRGLLIKKIEPDATRITYGYTPLGEINNVIDPEGNPSTVTYDSFGRRVSMSMYNRNMLCYRYDDLQNSMVKIDANGSATIYNYDMLNRVTDVTYHEGERGTAKLSYTYDTASVANSIGRLSSISKSYSTSAKADGSNGITSSTFAYDKKGNVTIETSTIDGRTFIFHREYDPQNRVTSITYPDSDEVVNHYSDSGYLNQVSLDGTPLVRYGRFFTDENGEIGNSINVNVEIRYNRSDNPFQGRPLQQVASGSQAPVPTKKLDGALGYDYSFYRITGNDVQTRISFDPYLKRPLSILSTVRQNNAPVTLEDNLYKYDPSRNITSIIDQLDAGKSQSFVYDEANRLAKATGAYGTQFYEYDRTGNLINKGLTNTLKGDLAVNVDIRFSMDTQKPVGTRLYYRDKLNPYAVTADSMGNSYQYDPNGNMLSYRGKTLKYDGLNRLIAVKNGKNGQEKYFYDCTGRRIKKESPDGTVVYTIGGLYELSLAQDAEPKYTKYFYGMGSDLVAQVSENNSTLMSFNAPSVYDAYYNTAAIPGLLLYCYRSLNHLSSDRDTFRFGILAILLCFVIALIAMSLIGFVKKYRFQMPRWCVRISPLMVLSIVVTLGLSGCDLPLLKGEGKALEGAYFFHPDYLGNVSYVTDWKGNKVSQSWYTPYGEIAVQEGSDVTRYKFGSKEQDEETGLYYFGARYYAPALGRWLNPDPAYEMFLSGRGGYGGVFNPANLNVYSYAANNPIAFQDPNGTDIGSFFNSCVAEFVDFCNEVTWSKVAANIVEGLKFVAYTAAFVYAPEITLPVVLLGGCIEAGFNLSANLFKGEGISFGQVALDFGRGCANMMLGKLFSVGINKVAGTIGSILGPSAESAGASEMGALNAECESAISRIAQSEGKASTGEVAAAGGNAIKAEAEAVTEEISSAVNSVKTQGAQKGLSVAAAEGEGKYVNLANEQQTLHILKGDATGGGHMWPGQAGKSVFPESWSGDKIMNAVSDIATDPSLNWVPNRVVNGLQRYSVEGIRNGINIKVILEPFGKGIITAWPK